MKAVRALIVPSFLSFLLSPLWAHGEYVMYNLSSTAQVVYADRMTHPASTDGNTTPNTVGGRTGHKNVNPNVDFYFFFAVDDAWAHQGSRPDVYINFTYYDSGTHSIWVQYDATGSGQSNIYRNTPAIALTNTNTWKQASVHVTDAYFGNRQANGADFRIFIGTGVTMTLDEVKVSTTTDVTPSPISRNLGEDTGGGLALLQFGGDSDTQVATIGGRSCRRNVNPAEDYYFYFQVSNLFSVEGSQPSITVTVDYYDSGGGSIRMEYDSPGDQVSNFYKPTSSVTVGNTNTWKTATFNVTDAYLGGRQNASSDFRIFVGTSVTRYLDLVTVTAGSGGGGSAPGAASNPNPASGATGVSTTPTLTWTVGSGATSRDIRFGTANPPPVVQSNTTNTSYAPATLSNSTTYFWRIDEKNQFGTTNGTVWSFTTQAASTHRFNATMDDGTSVVVDNYSSWSNSWIGGLVVAADRSTQGDCPFNPPTHKGLIKTGDRIFVNNNFLLWFDHTVDDGVSFPVPPYGSWTNAGQLSGWWTLAPSGPDLYFKNWKTGPHGCWNWAHNELIRGSDSPNQEKSWWDKYAFPLEHTLVPQVGSNWFFFSFPYAKTSPNSQYAIVSDGSEDAAGVHYKSSCRMVSWHGNIDVTDDNDANGVANYVQTDVEYICRPNDVYCIWNFRPNNANVICSNMYVALWSAYALDEDNTACDVTTGEQWPNAVYGEPLYNQSSRPLWTSWGGGPYSPGSIVQMVPGPVCSNPYVNRDIVTNPAFSVNDGDWIRCGESPSLSFSSPLWTFTNVGVPNAGDGSAGNPYQVQWEQLISWNETHDGTFGFGNGRGPYTNPADFTTLQSGKWYRAGFTLRTNY